MIKAVIAKNIKGSTFEMGVERLNLFTGRVGSGKTTIANAIAIALLGYYPAGTETVKQNGAIFEAFSSSSESMSAGVILSNGISLERTLSRTRAGAITEKLTVGGKKVTKPEYANAIFGSGVILFDVGAFTEASSQKKVEIIFSMFSVSETAGIETRIEDAKDGIKRMQEKIRDIDKAIEQQRTYRSGLNLPPGNIVQVREIISKTEADLEQAIKDCESAKIAEAQFRKEQEAKALAEAVTNVEPVDETMSAPAQLEPSPATEHPRRHASTTSMHHSSLADDTISKIPPPIEQAKPEITTQGNSPRKSIQLIIDAMGEAGCASTCFATMIAKRELNKYAA